MAKKPARKADGDAFLSVRIPADEARTFEHHAASLSLTPLELVERLVRVAADPYSFLAIYKSLTETDVERARRHAKHRRMAKAAVDAVLSGKPFGSVLEVDE